MDGMVPPAAALGASEARRASFTESRTYDWLVRLPLMLWLALLAYQSGQQIQFLLNHVPAAPSDTTAHYVNLLARAATLAFVTALFAFVVLRARPVQRAQGLLSRLIAAAGSFLPLAFMLFPANPLPVSLGIVSAAFVLIGTGLSVYVVFWLGRSFSMMPEIGRAHV